MRMCCDNPVIKHGGYLIQDEKFHSLKRMYSNKHMWDYTAGL